MRLAVTLAQYVNIPVDQFRVTLSQSAVINSFRAEIIINFASYTRSSRHRSARDILWYPTATYCFKFC